MTNCSTNISDRIFAGLRRISLSRVLAGGLLFVAAGLSAHAADTATRIIDPAFKTLKVQVDGNFMAPPVISLGGEEQLCISFDEMGDDRSYLRYSLIHCNSDWQPSGLLDSEILDSFNEGEVTDYGFSAGVFRHYVNYRVCLPNDDMRPMVSGNYLLQVYREGEQDTPVLQARFSVSEDNVKVAGEYSSITDRGSNDMWQQVDFSINTGNYQIQDPFSELIVKVEQNGVDVTPSQPIKPLRVEPGRLVYEHNRGLIFPAGNEFRRFETVRTDYAGMHIADNSYDDDGYTVTLVRDEERASRPYTYDRTQYGRFKVDEYSATDPDLGADYVNTVFTLDYPQIMNGDILIDGEFARSLPPEERTMEYDSASGLYRKSMMLKQGSYNYRYEAKLRTPGAKADTSLIEGNHYETCNEYVIKVYRRQPGSRYDRLIGTTTITNGL